MYAANVVADSVSPEGVRLTTIEVEYPHAIHKDIMTHRAFSRNFQSFRAYPPEKVIEKIEQDPFIPEVFESRVVGMGQGDAIYDQERALLRWMDHVDNSLRTARSLMELDLAKAQVNFVLQDLTWIKGIITATEWDNFWALRLAINPETDKPFARPEVYKIARLMKDAYDLSTPSPLESYEWHLPYIDVNDYKAHYSGTDDEFFFDDPQVGLRIDWEPLVKISVGRCARISYLTHDGKRDWEKDIALHDSLRSNGHMSPFEHQAQPMHPATIMPEITYSGNLRGWNQYRKDIPGEANYNDWMTMSTSITLPTPNNREIAAIGYLSAVLAAKADAWNGNAPEWFPAPPEWLLLWKEALENTVEQDDVVDPITTIMDARNFVRDIRLAYEDKDFQISKLAAAIEASIEVLWHIEVLWQMVEDHHDLDS
jgi:hypothetical protein